MTATQPLTTAPTWANAIAQPAREFAPTALRVLSGQIPIGLRGSLYRNGPGRLQRGNLRVGHWFDGDGAILAVHFAAPTALAAYRYVQTTGLLAEAEAGKYLYGNYGMTAPGAFWNQWLRPIKNAANTSVLALDDRLLALWEGGKPHALDLQTLQTLGEDDLGVLQGDMSYSAHPKCDRQRGEIFNFGVVPGKDVRLHLYKSQFRPQTGKPGMIQQQQQWSLAGVPLNHDVVLAGQYLVFCIPPVRLKVLPVIVGWQAFSDALEWKPELGTQILIFDRETLELVSRSEADPWFQWHFSNGFVDQTGAIVVHLIRYSDFQTNQYLQEVATGSTQTLAKGTLWQLIIDPTTGIVQSQEQLLDRGCEFPVVPPDWVGHDSRFSYFCLHRVGSDPSKELFGAIARFDHHTQSLTEADLGDHRYPSEPIYAPDADDPERGWILTVVFDGNTHRSEVWIFDSDRLNDEPVCRLGLPEIIPHSFHGTFKMTA